MSTFVVTRKSDGTEAHRYSADAPVEWPTFPFAEFDHVEFVEPEPPQPEPPQIVWDALVFLRRFTREERIESRERAKTDPIMADFFHLLDKATIIHSDDADVAAGLGYMATVGLLEPSRPAQILGAE